MSYTEDDGVLRNDEHEQSKGSEIDILIEDMTASQYFEFALPTRAWDRDTAARLGIPVTDNINLPAQSMTPIFVHREWEPRR